MTKRFEIDRVVPFDLDRMRQFHEEFGKKPVQLSEEYKRLTEESIKQINSLLTTEQNADIGESAASRPSKES